MVKGYASCGLRYLYSLLNGSNDENEFRGCFMKFDPCLQLGPVKTALFVAWKTDDLVIFLS